MLVQMAPSAGAATLQPEQLFVSLRQGGAEQRGVEPAACLAAVDPCSCAGLQTSMMPSFNDRDTHKLHYLCYYNLAERAVIFQLYF